MLEQRQDKVIVQQWDVSCGAAALASLLTYDLGTPVTEREVAAAMLRHTSVERVQAQLGFSLLDLKRYSESRDYNAEGYGDMTLRDLIAAGPSIIPVVLHGFNHFMVFRGVQGDRVLLADPAWGNRTLQIPEFIDMWQSRVAFMVSRKGDVPVTHPMVARPSDFWASSPVFEPAHSKQVVAQLLDQPPAPSQQFARAESHDPLSSTAAGPANGIDHGGRPESIGSAIGAEPVKVEPKEVTGATRVLTRVAAAPKPAAKQDVVAVAAKASTAAAVAQAVPRQAPVVTNDPAGSEVDTLLRQAESYIKQSDVIRARIYYELAAHLGSAKGAMGAARTYDPAFLAGASVTGTVPDPEAAARWYGLAIQMVQQTVDARLLAPHSS